MIGVGILGSGFIAETYADSLLDVRNAELVACSSRSFERAEAFAKKWGPKVTAHRDIDALCADPAVELVVIALPNEIHLEAVRIAAGHGKAVICTAAGDARKEAQILDIVQRAGIWHGYAECAVFSPTSPRPTR